MKSWRSCSIIDKARNYLHGVNPLRATIQAIHSLEAAGYAVIAVDAWNVSTLDLSSAGPTHRLGRHHGGRHRPQRLTRGLLRHLARSQASVLWTYGTGGLVVYV
jgi:hypothetical protein